MATQIVFPPDSQCFKDATDFISDCALYHNCTCLVTQSMVDFLNLTSGRDTYIAAYCLNPPSDDSCSFGFCDNPDIAGEWICNCCASALDVLKSVLPYVGPLVRIACEYDYVH